MLKEDKIIKDFIKEPRLSVPGCESLQFRPDFKIYLNDETLVFIDNTKTIRSDRLKQKQWEALGTQMCFKDSEWKTYYFVVVPNKDIIGKKETREKETRNVIREKEKIHSNTYFSKIDDIMFLNEFIEWLLNRA